MKRLIERLFECDLDARIKHIWVTPFVLVTWHEEDWLGSIEVAVDAQPYRGEN